MIVYSFWTPIPGRTQVRDLIEQSLLVKGPDNYRSVMATVAQVGEAHQGVRITYTRLSTPERVSWFNTPPNQALSDAVRWLELGSDAQFIPIPPISWGRKRLALPAPRITATLVGLIVAALAVIFASGTGAILAVPLGLAAATLTWFAAGGSTPTSIRTPGRLHLDASNLLEYAEARQAGLRPELVSDADRRAGIVARVDDLKAEYGALLTDIVFRIDNAAMFDAEAPLTRAFQAALVRWDNETDDLSTDDLDALATQVEIAYATARDHAETVGIGHLPPGSQDAARRASKAARLAADAGTDAEREAALEQVTRILGSLALYYLPGPEIVRRALPGRAEPA